MTVGSSRNLWTEAMLIGRRQHGTTDEELCFVLQRTLYEPLGLSMTLFIRGPPGGTRLSLLIPSPTRTAPNQRFASDIQLVAGPFLLEFAFTAVTVSVRK